MYSRTGELVLHHNMNCTIFPWWYDPLLFLLPQLFLLSLSLLLFSLAQFRVHDIKKPKVRWLKPTRYLRKLSPLTFTVFSFRIVEKEIQALKLVCFWKLWLISSVWIKPCAFRVLYKTWQHSRCKTNTNAHANDNDNPNANASANKNANTNINTNTRIAVQHSP